MFISIFVILVSMSLVTSWYTHLSTMVTLSRKLNVRRSLKVCSGYAHSELAADQVGAVQLQTSIIADIKKWRQSVSANLKKPAYLICRNTAIASIARSLPLSFQQLSNCTSFGAKSLAHSDAYLGIVKRRLEATSVPDREPFESLTHKAEYFRSLNSIDEVIKVMDEMIKPPSKTKRLETVDTTKQIRKIGTIVDKSNTDEVSFCLNSEKQIILDKILSTRKNYFISGPAGTGKSFLLKHLIKRLTYHYSDPNVTGELGIAASTGVAAVNIGGMTLHSFFGIGLGTGTLDATMNRVFKNSAAIKRLENVDCLIIDEISMVDATTFQLLDAVARAIRRSDLPFGGIRVIAVGDFFQLPPVQSKVTTELGQLYEQLVRRFYPTTELGAPEQLTFCFQSAAWNGLGLTSASSKLELETIVRQDDEIYCGILNRVRIDEATPEDLDLLNRNCIISKPIPDDGIIPTKIYCTNKDVDKENWRQLAILPGDLVKVEAVDRFVTSNGHEKASDEKIVELEPILSQLTEAMARKIPKDIELKIGAQVVLLRNIGDDVSSTISGSNTGGKRPLANGSRGVVIGFADAIKSSSATSTFEGLIPIVKFDCGRVEKVNRMEFQLSVGLGPDGEVSFVRNQIPLRLAWAVTVHKSQGTTLSRAELMINNAFDYGQVYVALSRVKNLDGLWLVKPLEHKRIKASAIVKNFYGK